MNSDEVTQHVHVDEVDESKQQLGQQREQIAPRRSTRPMPPPIT